jgi:GMP synthase (glutamine-hydrolysing)
VANEARRIYGVQFHPEVVHTPRGVEMLRAFLFDVAGRGGRLDARQLRGRGVAAIRSRWGRAPPSAASPAGVDSSVAAMLVHKALGDRLTCIFVDNGLLRKDEGEKVMEMFADNLHLKVVHVDARRRVPRRARGRERPRDQAQDHRPVFIEVFDREAKKIEGREAPRAGHALPRRHRERLVQGPERRHQEPPQRRRPARAHEPQAGRAAARALQGRGARGGQGLGMPHDVLWRQPFPGPGLAVRCLGAPSTREKLDILREADAIFEQEIRAAGLYEKSGRASRCSCRCKTVGVMGDERTYEYVIALRAVTSTDGMTADWARIAARGAGQGLHAHHQRGARRQPRLLRHLVEAARRPSSGSDHDDVPHRCPLPHGVAGPGVLRSAP